MQQAKTQVKSNIPIAARTRSKQIAEVANRNSGQFEVITPPVIQPEVHPLYVHPQNNLIEVVEENPINLQPLMAQNQNAQDIAARLDQVANQVAREAATAAVAASSPLSGLLALAKMPPSFSGAITESLTDWLIEYENFALRMRLDDQGRLDNLRALLAGPARTAYDDSLAQMPPATANKWEYIQNKLKEQFPDERFLPLREVEFYNRAQKPHETAEVYANALKELAKKVYRTATPEVRNRQLISQFLRGLASAELRQQIINTDKENPTLDDYVRRAMQLHLWAPDGILAQTTKPIETQLIAEVLTKLSTLSMQPAQTPNISQHCTYCKNRHFPYKNHTDANCFRKQKMNQPSKFCHICKKSGHVTEKCWNLVSPRPMYAQRNQPQQHPRATQPPPRYYTTRPNQIHQQRCHICNKLGHFARQCRAQQPGRALAIMPEAVTDYNTDVPYQNNNHANYDYNLNEKDHYQPTNNTPHIYLFLSQKSDSAVETAVVEDSQNRTVVVTNVPLQYNQDAILLAFSHFGQITFIHMYNRPHLIMQMAFITYENEEDAKRLLDQSSLKLANHIFNLEAPHPKTTQTQTQTPITEPIPANVTNEVITNIPKHEQPTIVKATSMKRKITTLTDLDKDLFLSSDSSDSDKEVAPKHRKKAPTSKPNDAHIISPAPRQPPAIKIKETPAKEILDIKSTHNRTFLTASTDVHSQITRLRKFIDPDGMILKGKEKCATSILQLLQKHPPEKLRAIYPLLLMVIAANSNPEVAQEAQKLVQSYQRTQGISATIASVVENKNWYVSYFSYITFIHIFLNLMVIFHRKISTSVYSQAKKNCLTMIKYIFTLFFTLSMLSCTYAIEYNLCGLSRSGYPFSVPKTVNCTIPDFFNTSLTVAPVELWIKRTTPITTAAFKCTLRTRKVCTYYSILGPLGPKSILSDTIEHQAILPSECKYAEVSKIYKNQNLQQQTKGLWSTTNTLHITFQYCCKEICTSVTNLFLEYGKIATVDGQTIATDLGDVGGCSPQAGYCTTSEGIIMWNAQNLTSTCQYQIAGTYNASIAGKFVIIDSAQISLTVIGNKTPPPYCKLVNSFKTAQGPILIPKQNDIHRAWLNLADEEQYVQKVNDTPRDPINIKLQYLEAKILQIENQNFRALWLELCRVADRHLHLIWQLLRLDPTLGARALTMQENIHASFAGDVLMIWKCRSVTPSFTFWNQTINQTCYEYLPVVIENQLKFVVPGSKDLVSEAPQVSCQHHIANIYYQSFGNEADTWQTISGPVHVSEIPLSVHWKGNWSIFSFEAPSIFHDKLADLTTHVGLLRSYVHKLLTLEDQTERLMNYTVEHSFDPDTVYQTLKGAGAAVANVIQGIGNTLENITTTDANTLIGGADKLLSGPLRHIVTLVTIIISFTIVIVLFYYGIRYIWPIIRKRNLHFSTDQPVSVNPFCPTQVPKLNMSKLFYPTREEYSKPNQPHPNIELSSKTTHSEIIEKGWNQSDSSHPVTIGSILVQDIPSKQFYKHWTHPKPKSDHAFLIILEDTDYNHDTPWSYITVNGKTGALARWDTGASHTVISESLYKILENERRAYPLHRSQHTPIGASGNSLSVLGITILDLTLDSTQVITSALVVPDLPCPLLIGANLLFKYDKIMFNWKDGKIQLDENISVLIFGVTRPVENLVHARSMCTTTISPDHEQILLLHVMQPDGATVLFEPIEHDSVLIARSVATVNNGTIPIRVCNPSSAPVQLYKNKRLGTITVVSPNDILCAISNHRPSSAQSEDTEFYQWLKQQKLNVPENISTADKQDLFNRILKYPTLIARNDMDIGCTDLLEHHIDTGDSPPFRRPPYRVAPILRKEIERQIDQFLQAGIIEPSVSPYASSILMVRKKDGSYRMCIDYRALNKQTKFANYPLPRIDDLLDALHGAKYFTTLDQTWAYLQVKLDAESKEKASFVTHHGSFQPTRMFFGLSGAPGTFSRLMSRVLGKLHWSTCLAYLDDVLIFGKTIKETNDRLELVLQAFASARLKLKLSKCTFLQPSVVFLGHHISGEGVSPDHTKLLKITACPIPKNITEVQAFNSLLSYYRRYIPNFSRIAQPLYNLLRKGTAFLWLPQHQEAFDMLKQKLVSAPVLAHPNFQKPWTLQTDASYDGLGAVLSQLDENGKDHPVAFYSRTLQKSERNYAAWEIEALAVVSALTYFRTYLYEQSVTVITDNTALKSIFEKPNPNPRIARWGIVAQQYRITFQYRKGKDNNADALSRPPFTRETTDIHDEPTKVRMNELEQVLSPNSDASTSPKTTLTNIILHTNDRDENTVESFPEVDKLIAEQKSDPRLQLIYEYLMALQQGKPTTSQEINNQYAKFYTLKDNVLYYVQPPMPDRIAIPNSMVKDILELHHDSVFAGHPGILRTIQRVKAKYHWPTFGSDIIKHVNQCLVCNRHKPPHHYLKPPLQTIPPPSEPWHTVAMDIKGPLPVSRNGNRYTLTFICYLTKYIECIPLDNTLSETIARALMHNVVLKHGSPVRLLSDNARNFTASLLEKICNLCNIKRIFTTTYHPQGDGLVERWHRDLGTYLRMYTLGQPDWDEYIPYAAYAHNTTVQSSIGHTPFELVYGRQPKTPLDMAFSYKPNPNTIDVDNYANVVHQLLTTSRQNAQQNIAKAHSSQKRQYDKTAKEHQYQLGDLVYTKNPKFDNQGKKYTEIPWIGPKIVVAVQPSIILVRFPNQSERQAEWIHISRTTPCHLPPQNQQPSISMPPTQQQPPYARPITKQTVSNPTPPNPTTTNQSDSTIDPKTPGYNLRNRFVKKTRWPKRKSKQQLNIDALG